MYEVFSLESSHRDRGGAGSGEGRLYVVSDFCVVNESNVGNQKPKHRKKCVRPPAKNSPRSRPAALMANWAGAVACIEFQRKNIFLLMSISARQSTHSGPLDFRASW